MFATMTPLVRGMKAAAGAEGEGDVTPVPKEPPALNQVIRLIASLGGFLGRKGDGEPGVKTLWLGLQRIADFASGLRYARATTDTS